MKKSYDWKDEIHDEVGEAIIVAGFCLPDGYRIAGISIVNEDNVEAQYFTAIEPRGDIYEMDVFGDLYHDIRVMYEECLKKPFWAEKVNLTELKRPLTFQEQVTVNKAVDKMIGGAKTKPLNERLKDIGNAAKSAKQQINNLMNKKSKGEDQ